MKSDDTNTYTMSYYEENELFWGPAYLYLGEIFKNGPKKAVNHKFYLVYSWVFYIIWKWIIKVSSCRVIPKTKALVIKKIVTPEALLIYHWCIFLFIKANFHLSISGDRSVFLRSIFHYGYARWLKNREIWRSMKIS